VTARVAVIGAGLAGLAAATRLRARGADVVALEAAGQPGGRARSELHEGFVLDCGAQVASAADAALQGLVAASGLGAELLPLRPLSVLQVRRGVADLIDPVDRAGLARIPGLRLLEALRTRRLERLLARFADILDPERPEAATRLDDRSLADFARLYFGPSVLERWMEPAVASWSGDDSDEASRVLFLLTCLRRRFAWPGTLRGGLGALADSLARGAGLRCNAPVEGVEAAGGRRLALRVGGASPATLEADAVVLATPAAETLRVAGGILAPAERDVLGEMRYGPALVLAVGFEAPLGPVATRILVPRAEGGPVETLLVEPGGAGGRVPEGRGLAALVARASWSAAHLDASDDVVAKDLLGALDRLHPGASARCLFTRLYRHRRARPRFPVGRYHALARLRRVAADRRAAGRRLYLAGDALVEPTLEGAVVSGLRAADEVWADLGG
jgi:oxygen-dependent protoporphyrinogen oxidase